MAANRTKLAHASNMQNNGIPRVWVYEAGTANVADVDDADFWGACEGLKVGDIIDCHCANGFVRLGVTAFDLAAGTSSVSAIGTGGSSGGVWVFGRMTDVSAAGSVYVVAPISGNIVKFRTVLQAAITSADSNVKLQLAGVDVTNGAVVVANSGSAAGDVDTATPTAANAVTAGAAIEVESDGASSTTAALEFAILIQP